MMEEIEYDHDSGNEGHSDSDSGSSTSSISSSTPTTTAMSEDYHHTREVISSPKDTDFIVQRSAASNLVISTSANNDGDDKDDESGEDSDDSDSGSDSDDITAAEVGDDIDGSTRTAPPASASSGAGKWPRSQTQAARILARLGLDHHVDSVVVRKKARDRTTSQGEMYAEIERMVNAGTDSPTNKEDDPTQQPARDEPDSTKANDPNERKQVVTSTQSSRADDSASDAEETDIDEEDDTDKDENSKSSQKNNKHIKKNNEVQEEENENAESFTEVVLEDMQVDGGSSSRGFQWCCCSRGRKAS